MKYEYASIKAMFMIVKALYLVQIAYKGYPSCINYVGYENPRWLPFFNMAAKITAEAHCSPIHG